MPQLILMRHGKAAQTDRIADRERPLTPRGRRDSEAMGRMLSRDFLPDRILCSPALRTRETLAAVLRGLGTTIDATFLDGLYDHDGDYDDLIAASGLGSERLMLIGHNPAIRETAVNLIGAGDSASRAELHEKFPTSAVVAIAFSTTWPAIEPLSGQLLAFLRP